MELGELVESLTAEEQDAVREFIRFLKSRSEVASPFVAVAHEFIEQHPELLRRLAQ